MYVICMTTIYGMYLVTINSTESNYNPPSVEEVDDMKRCEDDTESCVL